MRRTYGTDKRAELKIRIEQQNKDRLVAQANKAGVSMSEYVRQIVLKAINAA